MFDFLGLWKGYLLATNWVELHPLPLCKSLCSYVQNVAVRTAADLVTSRKEKLKTLELWETSIDSVKTDAVLMRALLSLGMISVINLPDNSGILVEFNDSQTVRCPGLLLKTLRQTPGPPSVSTSEVVQVISTEAFPVETDLQLHARLFEIIQRLRFEAEDLTTRLQVLHSENMLWTERRILQCDPSKHCDSWREFSASKASLDVAKTQAEKQQLVLQKLEEGESSADVINAIREQLHEVAAAQDCVDQARAELRKKEPDWKHQEYEYQRKRQRDTIVFEHYQTLLGADIDNVEKERHRLRAATFFVERKLLEVEAILGKRHEELRLTDSQLSTSIQEKEQLTAQLNTTLPKLREAARDAEAKARNSEMRLAEIESVQDLVTTRSDIEKQIRQMDAKMESTTRRYKASYEKKNPSSRIDVS
eukprot:GHVQ01010256.1.p1 GENE.GHVQ01010256.1~~GHVQ01010256.1.p1  ORF type:complete len:421 (-),score=42.75 GHVQ01010256.1:164-1426(-)